MTKYIEIMNIIADKIKEGKYKAGSVLPTEKELRRKYRVSITTIKKAMGQLQEKGYINRRQGSGTYVRENINPYSTNIKNIGIIINLNERNSEEAFLLHPSLSRLLGGVKKALSEYNANITIAAYHQNNPEPWSEIQNGLKIDAFLDFGFTISDKLAEYFILNDAKVLSMLNSSSLHRYKQSFPYVLIDHLDGIREAVRHYKKQGYQSFGYIGLAEAGLANFRDFEDVLALEKVSFDMASVIIHPERTLNLNNLQKRIEQIGKHIVNNNIKPEVFLFDGAGVADALIDYFAREKTGLEKEIRHCVIDTLDSERFQNGIRPDFIIPANEEAGYRAGKLLIEYIKNGKIENKTKVSPEFKASK